MPIAPFTYPVAESTPFDNDTNGFTSDNVQEAIEEARNSAIGTLLPYTFLSNGNTANKWLGYSNSVAPSNIVPLIVPQDSTIKGLTFSNADDDVDIDAEIYVNGVLQETVEIRNKRVAWKVGALTIPLLQGDRISVYLKKYTGGTGDSTAQDPIINLLGKFIREVGADSGIQTGLV